MTLEEHFYSFADKLDCFPGKRDYVSAYKTFKNFMNTQVHKEIKSLTLHKDGAIYLNDHSEEHVQMVIERISKILWSGNNPTVELEPFECFILLTAIQIHDAGHIVNGRVGHEKNCKFFLNELNKYIVGAVEKKVIYHIAQAHSGKDDPIGNLPQRELVFNCNVRMRMLAALLRIGDEMADDVSRASEYLFDKNQIIEGSRLFHAFSLSLVSFMPDMLSHDVTMKFNMNKERCNEVYRKYDKNGDIDIYLIDEIFDRTFKTFHECLYYNRFVPDTIRLNTVTVEIDFCNEQDLEPFFPIIKYKLEEVGYPHIKDENIYTLCGESLNHHGNRVDGKFIKNHINNKNEE